MESDVTAPQEDSLSLVSDAPAIVVIAGPNGAGKSTTAPVLLNETLSVREFVNADVIAQGLSAYAPEEVALQAGRVMLTRLRQLAAAHKSFAFETTLASRSFAPWLREQKEAGYTLYLLFSLLAEPGVCDAPRGRTGEVGRTPCT